MYAECLGYVWIHMHINLQQFLGFRFFVRAWFLDPDDCDVSYMVVVALMFVCLFTFLLWLIARHMRNPAKHRKLDHRPLPKN